MKDRYKYRVLDVALALHMCSSGASAYSDDLVDKCAWLVQRLEYWQTGRKTQRRFDDAVHEACLTAVNEYCEFEERTFKV